MLKHVNINNVRFEQKGSDNYQASWMQGLRGEKKPRLTGKRNSIGTVKPPL